ncbi:MAG: hypothetical protein HY791_05240 [Deltaproteobacteria bacterium]|nr:hypothetical protein [Deltaproteobacteria bacterium]
MTSEAASTSEQKHEFPCQACGATLAFQPGTEHLVCSYCGHSQQIGGENEKPIQEYSFEEAKTKSSKRKLSSLVDKGTTVACKGCGAVTVVSGTAARCPFCDAPVVLQADDSEIFLPESLLPFGVEAKKAKELFANWVKSRWFAPSDLAERSQAKGMDGVYLPYWTYDADTRTSYTGQRGVWYYVDESYTDSQGKRQTRRVRKTRWYPAFGSVRVPFDDVLVAATKSLPRTLLEPLEPWDLGSLKGYDPAFLAGFAAERYAIDLEGGFGVAQERMDPVIRQAICRDIGGDEQRIHGMRVQYRGVTFKHLLLPLWISSFRYGDKVYRFLVNARTGQASGERPYSAWKITFAVLAGLVLAYVLYRMSQ